MQTVRRNHWRRRLLRAGVLYALVVVAVISGCTDRLILFPSKDLIYVPGARRVEIDGPAGPLEIWTMRSRACITEPKAYVLEFVGNASRAEDTAAYVASEWGEFPVEVWSVNYPGYGGSAGSARLKFIGPAALAAFDEMKRRAGDTPIFVCGFSIGTTAALHVSAHRHVAGMVLRSPPPLRQLILGRHGWWNLWLLATPVALSLPADLDSIANAKNTTAPAVFIRTGADNVVPPEFQRMVFDAYAGEKKTVAIPNADHNDPMEGATLRDFQLAVKWLWTQGVATQK